MSEIVAIFSYVLCFGCLAALAWRDMREYILPDKLNAALALSMLSFHISTEWTMVTPIEALGGAALGGGFLFIARLAANKIYGGDALGLGDVKLMMAGGAGLGYPHVLLALSLGSCAGVLHGVYLARKQKTPLAKTMVPAGVGLSIGIAATMAAAFGISWIGK